MQSPMNMAAISQDAVYAVLGNAFLANVPHTTPTKLQDSKFMFSSPMDIEEQCNGVVHPIKNETITKYKKMIDEPLLCNDWMKAMCIELGRLAQGYGNTKGTDTIHFMALDEIPNIPADRTVTYARIVVHY